jgi:hypothetical protein
MKTLLHRLCSFGSQDHTSRPRAEIREPFNDDDDEAAFRFLNRMSLFDAEHESSFSNPSGRPPYNSQLIHYRTLAELKEHLSLMDRPEDGLELTVILRLGHAFAGHLPSLIARTYRGLRLLIVTSSGGIPGAASPGDMSLYAPRFGWNSISVHRELDSALQIAMKPITRRERCIIYWPS